MMSTRDPSPPYTDIDTASFMLAPQEDWTYTMRRDMQVLIRYVSEMVHCSLFVRRLCQVCIWVPTLQLARRTSVNWSQLVSLTLSVLDRRLRKILSSKDQTLGISLLLTNLMPM